MQRSARPIGISILSLLTALVGLLGLMLSLSLLMRAVIYESFDRLPLLTVSLFLYGFAYLLLAYGLWRTCEWVLKYGLVLLGLVLVAGLIDLGSTNVMALGRTMVFFLAVLVNIVVVMSFRLPGVAEYFRHD